MPKREARAQTVGCRRSRIAGRESSWAGARRLLRAQVPGRTEELFACTQWAILAKLDAGMADPGIYGQYGLHQPWCTKVGPRIVNTGCTTDFIYNNRAAFRLPNAPGKHATCVQLRHAGLCLTAWLRVRGRAGASSEPADRGSWCIALLHAMVSSSANLRVESLHFTNDPGEAGMQQVAGQDLGP